MAVSKVMLTFIGMFAPSLQIAQWSSHLVCFFLHQILHMKAAIPFESILMDLADSLAPGCCLSISEGDPSCSQCENWFSVQIFTKIILQMVQNVQNS